MLRIAKIIKPWNEAGSLNANTSTSSSRMGRLSWGRPRRSARQASASSAE
jgi:hypothetical protein